MESVVQDDQPDSDTIWQFGYGWWLIPGALLGLVFWIALIRGVFLLFFPT